MKHIPDDYLETLEDILDCANLTEENAQKSKKINYMRTIILDKYIYEMNRNEICIELDISWKTYDRYYAKALQKLNKFIR